ncbi:MAG TPA: Holliday junction resolvase RuvX [Candidatus Dojkabacteria bacterium]|nr:Holliday junction resolvase RuvX [Candidatus Dojkabacteria bacterium]HRO65176.1 Holliday junction resolvase RuvX [Candidatus Dojkabacteria bacterium]HRP36589.1 Holliday junction resolvase RuvX [Candidatus Dojkabacteria bacterium]HRP51007.1 Holliday junction resolvase RuvX [Candidatus Dojkabacteria bacterium]
MKILSIDHGNKRLGIAISDELGISAQALPTIQVNNEDFAIKQIVKLLDEHKCDTVLIGVPIGFEGKDSSQTKIVRGFINKLKSQIHSPIIEWDETYSSKIASRNIKGKKKRNIDSESAKVILLEYLSSQSSD